jgi:hypothetical protein
MKREFVFRFSILFGLFMLVSGCASKGVQTVNWDFRKSVTPKQMGSKVIPFHEVPGGGYSRVELTVTFPNGGALKGSFNTAFAESDDVSNDAPVKSVMLKDIVKGNVGIRAAFELFDSEFDFEDPEFVERYLAFIDKTFAGRKIVPWDELNFEGSNSVITGFRATSADGLEPFFSLYLNDEGASVSTGIRFSPFISSVSPVSSTEPSN